MSEFLTRSVFSEIATLLVLAAAVGFLGSLLRQPLIVSFIAVGLLAGPSVLDIVHSDDQIDLLSQLGIAVLLFLVGIKLDINLIRSLGLVSLLTGLGQVLFTSVVGYAIGLALGLNSIESLYVAIALTFSSTIIIVKLLSDKREIETLHGQIALGFLIVQDLVVVFAMVVLSAIGIGTVGEGGKGNVAVVLGAGFALVGAVALFVKFLADPLTERLARIPELLITFAIALAAIFAAVGDFIGLGKELGGLMAGVALASTRYREIIAARLAPLRDFLLLFFFIALGATLDLSDAGRDVVDAVVFSLFVLIGNPLIVLIIMGALGFRSRTGFLAGLTVAQISEFSLIFVAMGVALGHVGQDTLGLVTLVGLVTIAASTYMITYSHWLYGLFAPVLGIFERRGTPREAEHGAPADEGPLIIVLGLGRFGSAICNRLSNVGAKCVGVDINPVVVRRWQAHGGTAEFGDANDPEFLTTLPLVRAEWIVATVPIHLTGLSYEDTRLSILQGLRAAGFGGRIAVTSRDRRDTEALLEAGADAVLEPFEDAADRAVSVILTEQGIEAEGRKVQGSAA